MKFFILTFLFSVLFLYADEPIVKPDARIHPVTSRSFMVVSQDDLATEEAVKILKKGGNAADAAVALAYTLAVTQPKAGNIGGGGFALYYEAKTGKTYAIDFRESAPAVSHKDMYLDKDKKVIKDKSSFTLHASGVPGTVAGLKYLTDTFGKLKHSELIAPAIQLAENGFPVSPGLAWDLKNYSDNLKDKPELEKRFFRNGKALQAGEILKLPVLARTLKILQQEGPESFYTGAVSRQIVKFFQQNDGPVTDKDLANYKVRTMEPVKGEYRGYGILSMPPPSSGGVHVIQMLNILEKFDLEKSGANSAKTIHLMTEAMKLAYADRSKHLGDPDFAKVPVKGLISKQYADTLRNKIDQTKATPAKEISPGNPAAYESPDTTHFSIADSEGNVISFTYTINYSFGSRIMIPELGFILNNEMDDFSSKPGDPDAYGLIGGLANSIQPGKRPLSSMTPIIVMKGNKPWLITGSPGGSRIINTALQIILNVIDHKMNIAEATMLPRIHHQWLPDVLNVESGFNPDTFNLLQGMGHEVKDSGTIGCAETILIDKGIFYGFADPRRIDGKAAGK